MEDAIMQLFTNPIGLLTFQVASKQNKQNGYGCMCVYIIGHSPLGLFRTNVNKINKYSNKHNKVNNPN